MSCTSPRTVASTIVPFSWPSTRSMKRLEIRDRRLHRLGRLQHERQLHLAGAEQLADRLHAVEQDVVDDVERRIALPSPDRDRLRGPAGRRRRCAAARRVLELFGAALLLGLLGRAVLEQRDEGLQRVVALGAAVENQILGDPHLLLRDLVQRQDLREMHDRAGQPAAQRMVEKDRVQHLPRRRVQAERDVRQAEDDLALGHALARSRAIASSVLRPSLRSSSLPVQIVKVSGSNSRSRRRQAVLVAGEIVEPLRRSAACRRPPSPCPVSSIVSAMTAAPKRLRELQPLVGRAPRHPRN